jgi:hypothetical protein
MDVSVNNSIGKPAIGLFTWSHILALVLRYDLYYVNIRFVGYFIEIFINEVKNDDLIF